MERPLAEEFKLDVDPVEAYLQQTPALIDREKARTANLVAIILVSGVVAALPLHLLAIWILPTTADSIGSVFEKWFGIMGPLTGAAVGAYYAVRSEPKPGGRRR